MLIFLFMNLVVGASTFLLTYKVFKVRGLVDSLIALSIFYFAQIVLTELVLGMAGMLYLGNVVWLNIAILLLLWWGTQNKTTSFDAKNTNVALDEIFSNKIVLLLSAIMLGFGAVKIYINLVNPPFGWDSLNYHFTFPIEWLKHGNLDTPITIGDDPAPTYYPISGSLYFLWLIFPFKNVFVADLGQLRFFAVAFLAVYSLSRKLSFARRDAFIAASLFTIIPNYFKQIQIAYVDVFVAALFLAGLNFLFAFAKAFSLSNALLFSTSLGLLLGTKTIASFYSILLFIPFAYLCLRNAKKGALILAVSLFTILILGGFSYIRNIIETGNPLYPVDVKFMGRVIFKGVLDIKTYGAHVKPEDYGFSKLLFHEGLGAQTLLFVLPFAFLGIPITLAKKKGLDFILFYFLSLPILIYLIFRYAMPLANTRYLYPLLGVGVIAGFFSLKLLNVPKIAVNVLVVISALASMSELAKRQELVSGLILTFVLFFFLLYCLGFTRKLLANRMFKKIFFVFLIFYLIWSNKDYVQNEYARYTKMVKYSGFWPDAAKAWEWLNQNTEGNNVAYVGRPVPFPLYGSNLKNNVFYVSVNKTDPAKLHYFPNGRYSWGYDFLSQHESFEQEKNYRGKADYSAWLNNLIKRNADYLFIYSLHQTKDIIFPLEDGWAREHPEKFSPVFSNETIHVYKILR